MHRNINVETMKRERGWRQFFPRSRSNISHEKEKKSALTKRDAARAGQLRRRRRGRTRDKTLGQEVRRDTECAAHRRISLTTRRPCRVYPLLSTLVSRGSDRRFEIFPDWVDVQTLRFLSPYNSQTVLDGGTRPGDKTVPR